MESIEYIKTIIDGFEEANPTLTREQIVLELMNSELNIYLKNLDVREISYILNISPKQVITTLENVIGTRKKEFVQANGQHKITTRARPGILIKNKKFKQKLLTAYSKYKQEMDKEQALYQTDKEI